MTSILEELWGKIQECQKDFLAKNTQFNLSRKLRRQTVPERRSDRTKRLLIKSSVDYSEENVRAFDPKCNEYINMEEETNTRSASVMSTGRVDDENSSAENITEDVLKDENVVEVEMDSSTNVSPSKSTSSSSLNTSYTSAQDKESSEETSQSTTNTSCETSRSENTDSFQTPQQSTSEVDSFAPEPDSSAALGILNRISEELCFLNRDSEQLATSRPESKKVKATKAKKSTPSKIKFNFKTPTKSPSRLSSALGSAGKSGLSRSPSRSPFRFGYKTPTRSGQPSRLTHLAQSQKRKSVKRKVLNDSASPKKKKLKSEKKRKKKQSKRSSKKARTSEGTGETSSSDETGDRNVSNKEKKTGWTSSECDSSSEEENALMIMSETDTEVDEHIEEKRESAPLKLTVKNVRSLLKAVIGNEHVQDMLRNTLQEDGLGDALKEAIFEPKMTRSKVKQVMEQEGGQILHHMSPLKCLKVPTREPSPTILDINFNEDEDEDDEEYEPTADDINQMVSDDETETGSVTSSRASDFGSPLVSTPLTPRLMATPHTPLDESTPKAVHNLGRQALAQKARCVRDITKCDELNVSATSVEEEELIAKRTRSKLPLKDTLLEELEANFVAPDITPDMYDTTCDDQDWQHFLGSLVTDKGMNDTNDDEASDPEFNFLDELETEKKDLIHKDEVGWHRAVKISKKELHSLMDELFEAYNSGEPEMAVEEWNRQQTDNKKSKHQEKEKKVKKVEESTVEKTATKNVVEETKVTEEEIIDCAVAEQEYPIPAVSPCKEVKKKEEVVLEEAPESVVPPLASQVKAASEEDSSSETSSDPNEEFHPYVPPLKFEPQHEAMLVRDLIFNREKLPKTTQCRSKLGTQPSTALKLTEIEAVQLEDQMRKYVQLCTQMFVLTVDHSEFEEVADTQKMYIRELKAFGDRVSSLTEQRSAFHPCNLNGSLEILSKTSCCTEEEVKNMKSKIKSKTNRKGYMDLVPLTESQMEIFASSKVFLFPQMLPEGIFFSNDINEKRKCLWLPCEDNLLAMGQDQVGHLRVGQGEEWIGKLLVPTKTKAQISSRMKNLRSSKAPPNPIKYLKENKRLPEFPRYTQLEDEEDIVAPQDRDLSVLPAWFKTYQTTTKKPGTPPNRGIFPGVFIKIDPGSGLSSPKAIDMPENLTSTPTGSVPLPRIHSPALTPVQLIRSTAKLRQEKTDPPKASTFILPKSAFVPVGNSTVQLASGTTLNAPIIGVTKRANTDTAGRTSPVVVVAPNQLQSFGAQIIMLPSPNPTAQFNDTPEKSVVLPSEPHPKTDPVAREGSASDDPKTVWNTISLPETSTCSLDGEVLLDKLDMMEKESGTTDIHELTSYLTTGQDEVAENAATVHTAGDEDTAAAVTSNEVVTNPTTSDNSENTVTKAVGFNPIAPAQTDLTNDSVCEVRTDVQEPKEIERKEVPMEEGVENTSVQSSREAAPSPAFMRSPGFVQLGKHTRDSPNIFVAINNTMPPTGKKGTSLTVASRIGEISEARCSPLPEGLIRGISPVVVSAGRDADVLDEAPSASSAALIKDILANSPDQPSAPKETTKLKEKNPLLEGATSPEAKTNALNESAELHLEAPEVPVNKPPVPETPIKSVDILCTPVKQLPSERPGTYTSPMFSASPPVVVTPPANTPTKAAVEIMTAIAQIITTPSKASSPMKTPTKSTPPITLIVKTPPSKKNLMSMISPGKSFSSSLKSPILMQPLPSLPDTPEGNKTEGFSPQNISPEKRTTVLLSPRTPTRFKKIIPTSPLVKTDKKSPRRQILQQKARAIMPKGYTPAFTSPVKLVAATITAKAKKGRPSSSPVKASHIRNILPKNKDSPPKVTFKLSPRIVRRRTGKRQRKNSQGSKKQPNEGEQQAQHEGLDAHSECEMMESEYYSDENDEKENVPNRGKVKVPKHKRKRKPKAARSQSLTTGEGSDADGGDADGESGEEDDVPTDDDEEHLADLMAAATTINFDSRRQSSPTDEKRKGTAQALRDRTLQMLDPDLVEKDPLGDERDTAFAKAFLNRTQDALRHDRERYVEVIAMINQAKDESPIVIFKRMEELLKDHEDLIREFAGFLSPEHAMECGRLMDQQEFYKARLFLRKLEVFFRKHPNYWQKMSRLFTTLWKKKALPSASELKNMITPMLKGQKHLLEEFSTFFDNERPPESHMTDFEELTLPDSDDENPLKALVDEVEDIYLPDDPKDPNGTRKCKCHCHKNVKSKMYATRKRHCNTCALKIINGRLFLQTTEKHLRPAQIVYKIPPKKKSVPVPPAQVVFEEEDEPEVNIEEISSDDSNSSSDAPDREKIVVPSEDEEDGQSEAADVESEGGDSGKEKNKDGTVSSGEESVVNANTENDETSKGSEDKGGATSCTDVESINLNTEGSNTASAVCSTGTLSEDSDIARGSDCSSVNKSPRQPTDFSEFSEEIRKARESTDDLDSLDGLARELEHRMESDENNEGEIISTDSSNTLQRFQCDMDNFNTSTETLKGKESSESSSDGDEVLHQTDGSNDSYCIKKRSISREMTITTETVATITKFSEESITSPFKQLSRVRSSRSSSSSDTVKSNSSQSRLSIESDSQHSLTVAAETVSKRCESETNSLSSNSSDSHNKSTGSVVNISNTSSNGLSPNHKTEPKQKSENVVGVCKETMKDTERIQCKNDEDAKQIETTKESNIWTRENDQLLLLTCKQHGANLDTYHRIAELLPGKSEEEIGRRYEILMEKLQSWLQSATPQHQVESEEEVTDSEDESSYSDVEEEN